MGGGSGGGGRYSRVKDEDILEVFFEVKSPALSTSEVADRLPIGIDQTRRRLRRLEDEGYVQSKQIGKPHIWWHDDVQRLFEDDSDGSTSQSHIAEIGVEVIDSLDLPGGGLDLHARRTAVDAVFRHLFKYDEAQKQDLIDIAWEADYRQTYASPDNLWNDCIHRALSQPSFFEFDSDKVRWVLYGLGKDLKEKYHERCLWEDWSAIKCISHYTIYESFWRGINQDIGQKQSRLRPQKAGRRRRHILDMHGIPGDLRLEAELIDPFWLNLTGELQCQFVFSVPKDTEDLLRNNMASVESRLPFSVKCEHEETGDENVVTLATTREFTVDPNEVGIGKIRRSVNPIGDSDWIERVGEEFLQVYHEHLTDG